MKKKSLLFTIVFAGLVLFVGNVWTATATESPIPVPAGYALISDNNTGKWSSNNIDFSTFDWDKGTASYNHQLSWIDNNDGTFSLNLSVDTTGSSYGEETYNFLSSSSPTQFQAYYNDTTGGYFWLMEDITVSDSDRDYNDLWASVGKTAVPVPAAVWLFGSGLIGLIGLRRKKSQML
ncbi:exported hypothetical protein [Desulfamplus magnetovallimortis]|uniref:Ice-binding protein C-terminal domain-containing protein n=1 Tax=Desulfamplus magnetovallimortis TaxID=1246637 RepID=A0A1W1H957_9BACT|nr:VPLPA-CTERM sorting domain-containing protein [Desulfamplus magnetovallimortis]SLM28898.1 exported hypothetical protein [Desulfamplus magnetovallimortis]